MDKGIKNWMFVSVALFLVEVGRLIGGHFHWEPAEWGLDTLAVILLLIMIVRGIVRRFRR